MINRTLEQLKPIYQADLDELEYSDSTVRLIKKHIENDEFQLLPYFIVMKMIKHGLLKENNNES